MRGAVQFSVLTVRRGSGVAVKTGESTESPRLLVTVGIIITAFMLCSSNAEGLCCIVVTNEEVVQTIT